MSSTALHQRLQFDVDHGQVLDQTRRYVLMRADVLMGMFDALPGAARAEALAALSRSVAVQGGDSVRAYASQPGSNHARLLQTMQDSAASLGWGVWQFAALWSADRQPLGLQLTVHNSPFAAQSAPSAEPVCAAIAGMLQAVGQALWQTACQVQEIHCVAQGRHAECSFTLQPADPTRFSSDGLGHLFQNQPETSP